VGRLVLTYGIAPVIFVRPMLAYTSSTDGTTSSFQYFHKCSIFRIRLANITRISHTNIKSFNGNTIFQAHRYTCQWPFHIDLVYPFLSFWEHYFCKAIRLLVRANRDLAVAAQYVDRLEHIFVHVLNKLGNGLGEDRAIRGGDGAGIGCGEVGNTLRALCLFVLAKRGQMV